MKKKIYIYFHNRYQQLAVFSEYLKTNRTDRTKSDVCNSAYMVVGESLSSAM